MSMRHVTAVALLTWASPALSDDKPSVRVQDDGTVVGRLLIDADASHIKKAIPGLQDANASSQVVEARMVPNGSCNDIFRKTRGLWRPLEMQTRFCPTTTGWREFLVQSSDFNAYETEWVLRPSAGGGTQVQLKVVSDVNLMVPTSAVRSSTVASVHETLKTLLDRVFKPKKKVD
jgi:hypothetical protein